MLNMYYKDLGSIYVLIACLTLTLQRLFMHKIVIFEANCALYHIEPQYTCTVHITLLHDIYTIMFHEEHATGSKRH